MSQPVPDGLCPECGTPRSASVVPAPWSARHRRLVQFIGLLIGVATVAWLNWREWPGTAPPPTRFKAGVSTVDFPASRFTRADLEAYAGGTRRDGHLLASIPHLDGFAFTNLEMTAAFVPPSGDATDFRRIGWPLEWLVYRYDATYTDVYERTEPSFTGGMRAPRWSGLAHSRTRMDASGRREARIINLANLSGLALVLILAWYVGSGLRFLTLTAGFSRAGGTRVRDRAARALPGLCIGTMITGVVLLTFPGPLRSEMLLPKPWMPLTEPTGLTIADLLRLQGTPVGEATAARAILDAVERVPPTGDALLIGWNQPVPGTQTFKYGGWPGGIVGFVRISQDGADPAAPATLRVRLVGGSMSITRHAAGPHQSVVWYQVDPRKVAIILFDLWLVWSLAGLPATLRFRLHSYRARRRAAAGLCVRCGYSLAGLAAGVSSPA